MITKIQLFALYLLGLPILLGMGAAILVYRVWCAWQDRREQAHYRGLEASLLTHLERASVRQ